MALCKAPHYGSSSSLASSRQSAPKLSLSPTIRLCKHSLSRDSLRQRATHEFARTRSEKEKRKCITAFCMEASEEDAAPLQTVRIHYHRRDGDYESWGLHVWGGVKESTAWESPLVPFGTDNFGSYWDIDMPNGDNLNFLVHQGLLEDCGGCISSSATTQHLWLVSENKEVFDKEPDLTSIKKGSLKLARAYWITENLMAWPSSFDDAEFYLHVSRSAHLVLSGSGVEGADSVIKLEKVAKGLPTKVAKKFPHIKNYIALKIPPPTNAKELVKCQLAISLQNADGVPLDASGIQLPGVLDDVFSYDGPLGPVFTKEGVSLFVWAPTAQDFTLCNMVSSQEDK